MVGQPKQSVPIFVGSTFEDLQDYRVAVREALHRLEAIVRGMEYFGSKPETPKQECLKVVRSCCVYVGIFAMRYGSIDEETGKSMTELEYDEACKQDLPCLIYLIDEDKQAVLPKYVEGGNGAERLKKLKAQLKKKWTVSFFTTPDDLAKKIAQDLPPVLAQHGVAVSKQELSTSASLEDVRDILQKFAARPRKHAGKEIMIEAEIIGKIIGLDGAECEAFNLLKGEAIQAPVKSDVLGGTKMLIATGEVADWLENAAKNTKFSLKIRLLFGVFSQYYYDQEEGPSTNYVPYSGFRIIAIL
jgi:hypothetical protein